MHEITFRRPFLGGGGNAHGGRTITPPWRFKLKSWTIHKFANDRMVLIIESVFVQNNTTIYLKLIRIWAYGSKALLRNCIPLFSPESAIN